METEDFELKQADVGGACKLQHLCQSPITSDRAWKTQETSYAIFHRIFKKLRERCNKNILPLLPRVEFPSTCLKQEAVALPAGKERRRT